MARRAPRDVGRSLLTSAVRCFASNGFHATTTRDISGAIGLSPAALYVYFPSKELVLFEIIRAGHQRALELVTAPERATRPQDAVRAPARAHRPLHRVPRPPPRRGPGLPVRARRAHRRALRGDPRDPAPHQRRLPRCPRPRVNDRTFADIDVRRVVARHALPRHRPGPVVPADGSDSPEQLGEFNADLALRMVVRHPVVMGLMQDRPLALPPLVDRAAAMFGHKRVVTATASRRGDVDLGRRSSTGPGGSRRPRPPRRCPAARASGTFGWNSQRHLELYLAVPGSGRVLHTLNHRLFDGPARLHRRRRRATTSCSSIAPSSAIVWPVAGGRGHGPADRGHGRRRRRGPAGRPAARGLRRPARAGRPGTPGPTTSTSARQPASATPRARPAVPRACSPATARSCCTR